MSPAEHAALPVDASGEVFCASAERQQMVKSRGLNHINLNVSDIKRSLKFYLDAFGLEERFRERSMVFIGSAGKNDLITLCQAESGAPVGGGGGVSHFGFAVDKSEFDGMVAQVQQAGGTLLDRGEHRPGIPFAYFRDPDGYVIELSNA